MVQAIDKLVEISSRINKGVKGKDFCIVADHGMGYDSTPLENEYYDIVSEITTLLQENRKYITNTILEKLKLALPNLYRGYDSFRERTPACGGDYTDIDSPIKAYTHELESEFQAAQRYLKSSDKVYFETLKRNLLV
ncbi:MAG: hypothetical protein JXJ04_17570 [Spirochaetales bacterium]|nr:hypothetical protein [Spirochaetales bacterium]